MFLFLMASIVIKERIEIPIQKERKNIFSIDDSLYERGWSEEVELLAHSKDRIEGKYKKGFRRLTLGWSDGNTFCPFAFTHLSSDDPKNRYCEQLEELDKGTVGYRNRVRADGKSAKEAKNIIIVKQYKVVRGLPSYVKVEGNTP